MRLKGKVALIAGAGLGLGRATALLFAREGARVVVNDLSGRRAEEAAAEINGAGRPACSPGRRRKALAVRADVTRAAEVEAMVAEARRRFGPINVLVNNAGIGLGKRF